MTTTKPARAARGLGTTAPIFALFDLLGRRWALRILWELRKGPLSSRALAARCGGVSPTVLHKRLTELRKASLVDHADGHGYSLSAHGAAFLETVRTWESWAGRWTGRPGGR